MTVTERNQFDLINDVANRALAVLTDAGIDARKIDVFMDIDNVNRICPLRLEALLAADEYNFAHDVFGIYRHFNRETKELENCFLPRFAA